MKIWIVVGAVIAMTSFAAKSQTLIEATNSAEAVAAVQQADDPAGAAATALGLGAAGPVDLVFGLITPLSPASDVTDLATALVGAAPRAADEVGAAIALAAEMGSDQGRLMILIEALIGALAVSDLTQEARAEETQEVLAALLAIIDPDLEIIVADAVAGAPGGGAALLAALGEGPETAAIGTTPRSFGAAPFSLVLTPTVAAQDAPSAN